MTQKQLEILEQLLNDELDSYLDSGYGLDNDYVIELRNFLRQFNLKEYWDYDKEYGSDKE